MPHVFVNRPRLFASNAIPVSLDELMKEYFWESVNAVFYIVGGILLTIGSILFLPEYEQYEYIGAWIFIVASVLYLTVSGHDLIEITNHGGFNKSADMVAAVSYSIGAMNFILGSVFFLPHVEMYNAGAVNFVMGSILFVVGAMVNSIQIFDSPTRLTAFYANLVAVFYVVGSTLYLSASVPYLFDLDTDADAFLIMEYAAILYIWGSILFTIAGCINMYRARLIMIMEKAKHHRSNSNNDNNSAKQEQTDETINNNNNNNNPTVQEDAMTTTITTNNSATNASTNTTTTTAAQPKQQQQQQRDQPQPPQQEQRTTIINNK